MVRSRADHVLLSSGVILVLLTFIIFPFGTIPQALAQVNSTSNVTINITIPEVAEITVNPINFTVNNVNPGDNSPDENFSVKNTGSTNITNIFANVNTVVVEDDSPLGTGAANQYAASGFIFIRNESGGNAYHAGRMEWNISAPLTGEVLNLGAGTTNYSRGWYYNNSNTYLWKAENGTNGFCNTSGATLNIKGDPENATSGLQRDFTSGVVVSGTLDESPEEWGLFSFTEGPWTNYCVSVYYTCEKVLIYKYDKRSATDRNFDGCTQSSYLRTAVLVPGASTDFTLFASIPEGTPAGETNVSILTLSAT